MKKIICLLLCTAMLVFCACSGEPKEAENAFNVGSTTIMDDANTLKVFAIGNSFSNNTTNYLYDVAAAQGIENILLGRIYIPGCSLEGHVDTIQSGEANYIYYKNTTGEWVETLPEATLLEALQDEDWDIITLQQSSSNSGDLESYDGYLEQLIEYVNTNKTNKDAKLVWHMTWAYQGDSDHKAFPKYDNDQMVMYNKICQAVQEKILTRTDFAAVIPVGTAVQNFRTSYYGDTLTQDGFHLNQLGEVIGAYTWYAVFTGKPLETLNFSQLTSTFKLSDDNLAVIKEAVNNALKDPYTVTQSEYTE